VRNYSEDYFIVSKQLQVFRAKPNPFGKDKTSGDIPKPEQLLGEWVDIRNVGDESIPFSKMQLFHTLYGNRCEETGRTQNYWSGGSDSTLEPGQILRIHTGRKSDEALMQSEDRGSVDWRGFANRSNFVLNNACGDVIKIAWRDAHGNDYSDTATYKPNVPEGAILVRVGHSLVTGIAASY
jgi:hypothetical protein